MLVPFPYRTSLEGSLPYIALNSGGAAFYNGGNGTSVLEFLYTVEEGHASSDLDVTAVGTDVTSTAAILFPVYGAIFDANLESAAVVTLPNSEAAGSLGEEANIVIDTE